MLSAARGDCEAAQRENRRSADRGLMLGFVDEPAKALARNARNWKENHTVVELKRLGVEYKVTYAFLSTVVLKTPAADYARLKTYAYSLLQ